MIEALLETFAWAPPGHAALGDTYVDVLTGLMTQSFALGIRAAAPLLIALLLSTIVLGLISRTLPQINIIAVGFGLNSLLTLAMTAPVARRGRLDVSRADDRTLPCRHAARASVCQTSYITPSTSDPKPRQLS